MEKRDLDRKTSWRDEYLKRICGLANAKGGILEVGKNDRGEITGVENPLRLLEEIPDKTLSLLGILVEVNLRGGEDGEYVEIVVDPHPNPISYRGEYYYRSGSTRQVLRGAALNRFLLRKHGRNWDDAPLPGVSIRALDPRGFEDFQRRGRKSGRLPPDTAEDSRDDLIEMLQLREGEHLRRAAVLLFHARPTRFFPGAFVKIGYFSSETDIEYQDVVEGDLFDQTNRSIDLLCSKYARARITYEGIYRRETPPVPNGALREAVLNAVTHRDYSSLAPIQIRVYDDRISLWNPGTLPADWTLDDLVGTHASVPHNPLIANAFFRAGLVEGWGRGVEGIVKACRSAGTAKPLWELKGGGVRLSFTFNVAPASGAGAEGRASRRIDNGAGLAWNEALGGRSDNESSWEEVADRNLADETTQKTIQKTTQNAIQMDVKTVQATAKERILECLRAEPGLTQHALAERVELTPAGVKYHLRKLKEAGFLQRVGSDRSGHWRILDKASTERESGS